MVLRRRATDRGSTAFREAVVALAREQARASDYDVNNDRLRIRDAGLQGVGRLCPVLAGSSMWQDRSSSWNRPTVRSRRIRHWIRTTSSPRKNPELSRPFVVRSYYDDRNEIFRIDNVAWRDDGLMCDIEEAETASHLKDELRARYAGETRNSSPNADVAGREKNPAKLRNFRRSWSWFWESISRLRHVPACGQPCKRPS